MTLALLLTAVTGAWATDGVKLTTTEIVPPAAWNNDYTYLLPSDMPGLKADAITEEQAKAWADVPKSGNVDLIYGYVDAGDNIDFKIISFIDGQVNSSTSLILSHISVYNGNVKYYYATGVAEPAIDVKWDAKAKTGSFVMPAFDVEIAPIYAPVAQWAKVENVDQLPTAIEGIFAGTTDAIVKAGTVAMMGDGQTPQGIVMYAVTSINQATAPELSAFSATVPTAENIADEGADVLVWYYIQGANTPDGQEATAENTFNDSEICETPIKVTVLPNKYDIQFNAANANTIEAGKATVTVGGTAATVTEGKLEGVKMGSEVKVKANTGYKFRKVEVKKAPKTITIGEQNYTVLDGETWKQFITRNQLSGWSVQPSLDTTWRVRMDAGIAVFTICISTDGTNWEPLILTSEDAPIDTDKQYKWG